MLQRIMRKVKKSGVQLGCTELMNSREEQRRKYDQFAVNGVSAENFESKEQMKSKKKKKNKKKKVPLEESEEPMGAAAFVDMKVSFSFLLFVEIKARNNANAEICFKSKTFHQEQKEER